MRSLTFVMIGAMVLPTLAPALAAAQSRDRIAVEACSAAIEGEVHNRYPQARAVRLLDNVLGPGAGSNAETRVGGRGEFDDRNGGAARFAYDCTFNARTGATYALDVRDVRPVGDGKKDNSAAIAGLVLGIIVGALAASADDDQDRRRRRDRRDDIWSPADGVRCNAREAACYKNGGYSEKWTRRIFVR